MESKYKRVLLKVSGESMSGGKGFGVDDEAMAQVAEQVKKLQNMGVEVAMVVGGGNFWRGRSSQGMDRASADYMGMLATCMNGLALEDAFRQKGMPAQLYTALSMPTVAEPYNRKRALADLESGTVVIFSAGTGSPFFSTDTAAALRAVEMGCDVILMGKTIDAVYDSDPKKNPGAKKFTALTHQKVLELGLEVMDSTAASLCRDNHIGIHVFGMAEPDNVIKAVCGEPVGTVIE